MSGKSAIEWVMECYQIKIDKDSQIKNDPNDWALEHEKPRYILDLLLSIMTVSLETMRIVNSLPKLDIPEAEDSVANKQKVVPFRRVTPKAAERYQTCVPLVSLQAAAGAWSDVQEGIRDLEDEGLEWVTWDPSPRFAKGMFVAPVCGRSMEPGIADGAHCLFRAVSKPSSPDRPMLVRFAGATDPETGGQFAVKRYREERGPDGSMRIVLLPTNDEFDPMVITGSGVDAVRVIGEVVDVLSG